MLNKLLFFIALFFMLTGIISVIYFLILRLLTPRKRQPYVTIIPLTEYNNPTGLLASAIEKRNICGESQHCELIGVDLGLTAETRSYLAQMYCKSDRFTICDYKDLQQEIEHKLTCEILISQRNS